MRSAVKNFLLVTVSVLAILFCHATASAQTEEMKVADKVDALVEQLQSASYEERDEAEKEILKIGSDALDYIDDPSDQFEEDLNKRLTRVRKQLEQIAIEETISPSKITISGEMTLKQAFAEVKRQSGNVIALGEGYDPAFLEKKITLDLTDASFWDTFVEIKTKGGLDSNTYGGELGQATVIPRPAADPAQIDKAVTSVPPPSDDSGIFRMRVSGVSSARNLLRPELDYTRVDLEIQWEPRLTPISIDMPLSKVKFLDADGNELKVSNPDQVLSGVVQQGINQIEMSLTLENVNRDVKSIGDISGRLECILPGRREKFRFAELGSIEGEPKVSKAGVSVQYLGYEQNEDLYAVNLRVAMESNAEEFESHLGWLYDNPLFLINDAGKKEPSIGHQGGDLDERGVQIQYFFVEEPANFGLLYESPGAIVSVPADFKLKDIPLP
ncbi:hypothetical protein [Mariniblastus fucicola]|uniref:Uncharacterized protein n=1 Tax=Mariniblastus fucicola TaxID=980251 RepID=A0A5B9PEA4_9BACT|nr:hypothetical protein [Mariniblastus fucicola]QEG21283.1 hypothetical protein MFFC18_11380 [Mariniblastus fucicola]